MNETQLKIDDFVSIALKANNLELELKKEMSQQHKTDEEIDQAVKNKVKELIKYIAQEDILGETRLNEIVKDIISQFPLDISTNQAKNPKEEEKDSKQLPSNEPNISVDPVTEK